MSCFLSYAYIVQLDKMIFLASERRHKNIIFPFCFVHFTCNVVYYGCTTELCYHLKICFCNSENILWKFFYAWITIAWLLLQNRSNLNNEYKWKNIITTIMPIVTRIVTIIGHANINVYLSLFLAPMSRRRFDGFSRNRGMSPVSIEWRDYIKPITCS